MGLVTYLSYSKLTDIFNLNYMSEIIILFMSVIVGIIVYSVCIIISNVEEINFVVNTIKSKLNKKMNKLENIG